MKIVAHVALSLAYISACGFFGFALYQANANADPAMPIVAGGLFALAMGFTHAATVRRKHDQELRARIAEMQEVYDTTRAELAEVREQTRELGESVKEAIAQPRDMAKELYAIVQTLQGQLAQRRQPAAPQDGEQNQPAPLIVKSNGQQHALASVESAESEDDAALAETIRDALENNRLEIFLQPVVSLPQRKTEFFETFSCLRTREGKLIEPRDYIGVAERTWLVSAIDNNLLFRSVQLAGKSSKRSFNFAFFCNISNSTINDHKFFPEFIAFMEEHRELAPRLIFEFAHANFLNQDPAVTDYLDRLARLGFRSSVDQVVSLGLDFTALAERNVRFAKIDAGALLELCGETDDPATLDTILRAFDRSGITLIIAKIEQERQLVELLDHPVGFGQGYLFGKPRLAKDSR